MPVFSAVRSFVTSSYQQTNVRNIGGFQKFVDQCRDREHLHLFLILIFVEFATIRTRCHGFCLESEVYKTISKAASWEAYGLCVYSSQWQSSFE